MSDQSTPRVSPELEDVAAQIGQFIEYFGFKAVHGRIWTHLLLSTVPLTAGDLIARLKISKALVSMSIADLQAFDVISVSGKGHRGSVTYVVNPNILNVITTILRQRERRMLSRISAAVRLLEQTEAAPPADAKKKKPDAPGLDRERIGMLRDFVHTAESTLDRMLQFSDVSFQPWMKFANLPGTGDSSR